MTDRAAAAPSIARWDLPAVSGKPVQARRAGKTVGELEDLERRTYEEAFAKGREAGLAAARAETEKAVAQLKAQVARLDGMLGLLAQPLHDLDAQVEQQLTHLALTIARQLVRRELRIDPAQVIAVIRETVALLPAAARDVRVHMHPEDAAVVREKLAAPGAERAWTIVEDPVMTRGGCRVTTDTAQIDARLETRINSVISTLLGDERATASRGTEEQE
ncbi:MAG: flagellar assembly protein FliH [Lysobacterales bacterium]|nr:MAG: flagellar assembly protein FliH [Xanthomonadales bacterium]